MALYHETTPLHLQFLLLLVWITLAAGECDDSARESIQFPLDVRSSIKRSPDHIEVVSSQSEDAGSSNQQSESLTEHSSDARLRSSSCEPRKSAPPIQSNSNGFTCTAHCPMCPLCPQAPACPSPCPAVPQCPTPQVCPKSCAACPACPSCMRHIPPGYEFFPGHGYYRLHTVPVVWMQAKETCEREGAHLVIINSQEEANLMKTLFSRDPEIGNWLYLGFHDLYKEGRYVTLFGQPLSSTGYTLWNPGQPDNHHNNENCGSMYLSGGLNDLDCSSKQPFVCELPV